MNRFRPLVRAAAIAASAALVLSACSHRGHNSSSPVPLTSATPSPGPSSTPSAFAYTCSSDGSVPSAAGRATSTQSVRRMMVRRGVRGGASTASTAATQLVAVNYTASGIAAARPQLAARESTAGAAFMRELSFSHTGVVSRILSVPTAQVATVEAAFRKQPGVTSVGLTGSPRHTTSVTSPYFPNDPMFDGYQGSTSPLYETSSLEGQWDMHAIRLEYAFGYSQVGNGSSVMTPAALGSSSVKLAVIDTGADVTHPELNSKIVYQRCFLTNAAGSAQSTSNFVTDQDGHGTNVAGIAAAATNNAFGFAGAGGNVELYDYRVFPTPDDSCAPSTTTTTSDDVCNSNSIDIADAIQDAISNHVNVINMSLGGSVCTNGKDPDNVEGAAVADAIAANIVVVASAGNFSKGDSSNQYVAPACDPGVIAVGATSLADGVTNGSSKSGGSSSSPFEYVASYSFYGSPAAQPGSASAWGIVAPGGDGSGSSDTDNLHWIENIWTSTPYQSSSSDNTFVGECSPDPSASSSTDDCRTLIAGTSQASPHVAGAAALILSVNPAYQSPTAMKTLLCTTADDIGDPNEGCGRLDVYRAMATALGDPATPATNPIP